MTRSARQRSSALRSIHALTSAASHRELEPNLRGFGKPCSCIHAYRDDLLHLRVARTSSRVITTCSFAKISPPEKEKTPGSAWPTPGVFGKQKPRPCIPSHGRGQLNRVPPRRVHQTVRLELNTPQLSLSIPKRPLPLDSVRVAHEVRALFVLFVTLGVVQGALNSAMIHIPQSA